MKTVLLLLAILSQLVACGGEMAGMPDFVVGGTERSPWEGRICTKLGDRVCSTRPGEVAICEPPYDGAPILEYRIHEDPTCRP